MYENLWVIQQMVDQRTAEREAEAAAHRLAKEIQHDRGNRSRQRFSRFGFRGHSGPAVDARTIIDPQPT